MTMTCALTIDGRKWLAKLLRGDSDANAVAYVGIGDGTTALDPYQYTLENEIATRVAATLSYASTYVRLTFSFSGLTAGDDYSEFGVFDLVAGGIMYSRHSPSAVNPGESTTVTAREIPSDGVVAGTIDYYIIQGTY